MSAGQADIFQLVEGRRRRRKNTKGESTPKTPLNNPASGDACAPPPKHPQKTSPPGSKWTPKPTNHEVVQKLLTDIQIHTSKVRVRFTDTSSSPVTCVVA
ncbi:hypothetical protein HPB52_017928 [Rhipicephalus sanguineus]|uniref:Uncharacterized protein n=1 Tax=Rhipicephalus sanguineus TaxID=34632 RepID=A0A9D4PX02_RHISA|nr:hypothetical protein HPB52_017928 [Rhipicephalus sanguineus]